MTEPAQRIVQVGRHRVGQGDMLDLPFQQELCGDTTSMVVLDVPYACAIDRDAARRSKAAGMRNGKLTCVTAAWDAKYHDGGGGWTQYASDLAYWVTAAARYRHPNLALIVWGWSLSLPYVYAAGAAAGLTQVTTYIWAKPTASPRFAKNCLIVKSCEFAVIFRGKAKLDVFGPLIRDHIVMPPPSHRDRWHQTEKPAEIYDKLIGRFCPPDGTVYDPMCGSGTTGYVCEHTGRSAILADSDPIAYEATLSRIGRPSDMMRKHDQLRLSL